ncbi:MAG: Crp/Fnr family transcriptional regulator [Gemmatimonadota bacterium]|nr:Crp/Fnr family transcriptional regulator [Gemmatimonadota bacterium]
MAIGLPERKRDLGPLVERLRGCSALAEVETPALTALAAESRLVRYAEGQRLFSLLESSPRLQFLSEGLAKLVGTSRNGRERILYVYRPGEIVGARYFIDTPESSREVVAMEPAVAVVTSPDRFQRVGRDHPRILLAVTREFTARLHRLNERTMAAMGEEVPVRLCRLLLDFSDSDGEAEEWTALAHPLTHRTMAQIIGASRPHTSATLATLEDAGAVRRNNPHGLSVRPSRLREIVHDGVFERKTA